MDEIKFKLKPVEEKTKIGSEKGDNTVMWIVFDASKQGLETVMRGYTVMAMRFLWERGEEGANSREIWLHVIKILMEEKGRSISRASIINVMNEMVDAGILNYKEEPGKGGYPKVYFSTLDEEGVKMHVSRTVISKLLDIWPSETREILIDGLLL